MAEPTLSLTRDQVRQRIALFLGFGMRIEDWDADQVQQIDLVLTDGLGRFYRPVTEGKTVYEWSFLKPTASLTLIVGTSTYDLPDDCDGAVDRFFLTTGADPGPLLQIPVDELLIQQANDSNTGTPKYFAVRPKAGGPNSLISRRWEVIFFPTPNEAATARYHYPVNPDAPGTGANNPYLLGGSAHSQTIVASCLAVAEMLLKPMSTAMGEEFARRMAASIAADERITEQISKSVWSVYKPPTGHRDWFRRAIAGKKYGKFNLLNLTHDEECEVELILSRALDRFYTPPALPGREGESSSAHRWSFLCPVASLTVSAGISTYTLPSDFREIIGPLRYPAGSGLRSIFQVDESVIALRAAQDATPGTALEFAIRPKTTDGSAHQTWELLLGPTPPMSTVLTYKYARKPVPLTSLNPYPYGGVEHAETIHAACMCVITEGTEAYAGCMAVFMERMTASIAVDQKLADSVPQDTQTWMATEPPVGHRDWFLRAIAGKKWGKWNLFSLKNNEEGEAELILARGLNRFYFPPGTPVAEGATKPPHRWSFLSPIASLSITAGVSTYDLPADFREIAGPLRFPAGSGRRSISQIDEKTIAARVASDATQGIPTEFAIRPKASTGSDHQTWEIILSPTPSVTTTLTYPYARNPAPLTTTSPYPYGGVEHAETIHASCMCVIAEGTDQYGASFNVFLERLTASVAADKANSQADASETWSMVAPTFGSYDWLAQQIASELKLSLDPGVWTVAQTRQIDLVAQRGIQTFLMPELSPFPHHRSHRWSFLFSTGRVVTVAPYSTGTIAVTAGVVTLTGGVWPNWTSNGDLLVGGRYYSILAVLSQTQLQLADTSATAAGGSTYSLYQRSYDLPANVQSIVGDLTLQFGVGQSITIKLKGEQEIREGRARTVSPGFPQIAATIPGDEPGKLKLALWPYVDAIYDITFKFKIAGADAGPGDLLPGGRQHAETVLHSCLMLVTPKHADRFEKLLAASIEMDQVEQGPESVGPINDEYWPGYDRQVVINNML